MNFCVNRPPKIYDYVIRCYSKTLTSVLVCIVAELNTIWKGGWGRLRIVILVHVLKFYRFSSLLGNIGN